MIGAIGAIGSAGRIATSPGVEDLGKVLPEGGDQTGNGAGFSTVFDQITGEVAHALKAGEQAATQGILGTGSVQATVEGVMAAEQSLQIGIGVRDRIVNAYLELSRMAI